MNDDAALLRRYAEEGSDPAFTELVHRHVNLVYGSALRRTGGDAHRAADVAQQVFITLAREARRLSGHTVLPAWLHTATRNAALNLMISEKRREAREFTAQALGAMGTEPALDWERLRPVIDAAIDDLPENDRAAVVLRFLEQRPFAEVGTVLRVSEDAARMRTDRALDKLRDALGRRGITSTAAALSVLVSAQPLLAAPAGLAATLAIRSLASAGATVAAGAGGAAITFMSLKLLTTAVLTGIAAFGAGAYFGFSRDFDAPPPLPVETPKQVQMIASLRQENQSLRAEVDKLNASVTSLRTAAQPAPKAATVTPTLSAADAQMLKQSQQRATLNNLRQLAAAIDQFYLENGRSPGSLDEIVGETKYVRRLIPVAGENYSLMSLAHGAPRTVVLASGEVISYDPSAPPPPKTPEMVRADELTQRMKPAIDKAVQAYKTANNGTNPKVPEDVIAYFATPQEGADFVEVIEAQKAAGRYPNPKQ